MDDLVSKYFEKDPKTGELMPKKLSKNELERANKKKKIVTLQSKYKHYIIVDNVIKTFKRLGLRVKRFIHQITHPLEFIEAKVTAYRLRKLVQDPILMDALFEENINPVNLQKVDGEE